MNRRRFLVSSAVVGVSAAAVYLIGARIPRSQPATPGFAALSDQDKLLSLLRDRDAAAAVGARYLQSRPDEVAVEPLLAAVRSDVAGVPSLAQVSEEALASGFRGRVRRDFAEGRVVELDGWILSSTEANLCTLAALAARRG